MTRAVIEEDQFINMFEKLGPTRTAEKLGVSERSVYQRRRRIERLQNTVVNAPFRMVQSASPGVKVRRHIDLTDGTVLVFNDSHYWPNEISTAHLSFLDMCKKYKPDHVVNNGDAFDGARVSRFDAQQWEDAPTVADELEAVHQRLMEIRNASKKATHWWCLGNHDYRFESRLIKGAPEFEGIRGMHLKDHFPDWIPAMSLWVNEDVVIKHRYKGGIHAGYSNTIYAGKTIVTGHTHQMTIRNFRDYNGTRYGVECGTLAEPYGPQFAYMEDNPRQWESGFMVLTFRDGELMRPEPVTIPKTGFYEFRGKRYEVG